MTTLPPGPWLFSIMPWDMRQEITLQSHTGSPTLDLSLLRVSKQLNRECKEVLWRNTVVYRPFEVYRHTNCISETRSGPLSAMRRVAIQIDMPIGPLDVDGFAWALKSLGNWSKYGSLEEVTIIVVNERRKPFEERDPKTEQQMAYKASLERVIRFRTGRSTENLPGIPASEAPEEAKRRFKGYLSALRDARDGCLSHLRRKIVVNTNFGRLLSHGQQRYLREALMDPNELMMELNKVFGGELWIDGKPCYTGGKQIMKAFQAFHMDDHSDSQEAKGANLIFFGQDQGVSNMMKPVDIPEPHIPGRAPWGQLLEEQASVLDVVE